MHWLLAILAAYLVGAIPFGLLIGLSKGVDIRAHGSGNIGATNAMRVLGKPLGIVCFVLDLLKGLLPPLVAGAQLDVLGRYDLTPAEGWLWLAVAVAAVLGHIFPIYLRLRGGKGVATGFGALLALWPYTTVPAAVALVVWLVTLRATRYVSASSVVAACSVPVTLVVWRLAATPEGTATARAWPFLVVSLGLAALVVWRHRSNLARIRAGTERKVGSARRADGPKTGPGTP